MIPADLVFWGPDGRPFRLAGEDERPDKVLEAPGLVIRLVEIDPDTIDFDLEDNDGEATRTSR